MKKILLIALVAVLGASTAFTVSAQHKSTQKIHSVATGHAHASAVTELRNDNQIRPNMRVKRLTILDFNATWCGPCKQFHPAFNEAANKYGKKVDFISIDIDRNPQTARAFGVQSIPTVIFIYPNGRSKKYVGTQDLLPTQRFLDLVRKSM